MELVFDLQKHGKYAMMPKNKTDHVSFSFQRMQLYVVVLFLNTVILTLTFMSALVLATIMGSYLLKALLVNKDTSDYERPNSLGKHT